MPSPWWPFALASLLVAALVAFDPLLSALLPHGLWQRLHLLELDYKLSWIAPLLMASITWLLLQVRKAPDARSLWIVLLLIALQTNGIKLGPGLDLITFLPFLIALGLLAEAMLRPDSPMQLSGLTFFGLLLLLLDLPHLANPLVHSPVTFLANFVSVFRALLVAFVLVNLIQTERHLTFTLQAFFVVAMASALVSVGQTAQAYFTGNSWTLVAEELETKPTFLGTTKRSSGLTAWPSWLADFLVMALPFTLFRLVNASTTRARAGHVLAVLLLLAGVVGTFTYASYAAFAVILLLFPVYGWPHRALHFLIGAMFFGALFYAFGGFDWAWHLFHKLVLQSAGIVERDVYLKAAIEELSRDPWWGSGFHAEQSFSENFYRKRVHNTGLQLWTNLGLAGFLVYLAMLGTLFTQLWLLAMSRSGPIRQHLQALALGLTGIVVEMFAEPHMSAPLVWFYLALAQSAILIANRQARGRPALPPPPAPTHPMATLSPAKQQHDA
ncbi:O-antigen ligase family protein [Ideonella sp. DXS22W]|uniref:O-antigen ligase family protein n=1 Tax=Pseudaquabacterium inlustre TaxID=2984192 RepID=A0ABU9CH24_9BURK